MKFDKGETVVEPTIGICKVIGMKMMHVDEQDIKMYIFEAQGAYVYVPASKVVERGIRRPMTRDDVKRVLATLKTPVAPNRDDARMQYVNYRDIMKSGDPMKITRLLRDLFILDQSDDLKGKEKEIMDQARKFLIDEIAFVREISKSQVQELLNEALRMMYKKKQTKDKEKAKKSGTGLPLGILGYEDEEQAAEAEEAAAAESSGDDGDGDEDDIIEDDDEDDLIEDDEEEDDIIEDDEDDDDK